MLFKSLFLRDVLSLSAGTAIGQAVALGLLPILTRLFTPEDFGTVSLYVAIAGLLYVLGSGKFEATIPLARVDREAAPIVKLIFYLSIAISSITLIVVVFFSAQIAIVLGNPEIENWLYFLPVSIFCYSNYLSLRYWLIRKQQFRAIASSAALKPVVNYSTAGAIHTSGATLPVGGGLVIGVVLAEVFNSAWLFFRTSLKDRALFQSASLKRCAYALRKRGPMAGTLAVSQGIGVINSRLPVFIISSFFGGSVLGLYFLAERVAFAPSQLIAGAIGDVYRQRAAVAYNKHGEFRSLMLKCVAMTLGIAIIPYTIGILFAPQIFTIVFGPEWEKAGEYASIILVGSLFSFVIVPIDKGAIIVDAKAYIFSWHVLRMIGKLILLLMVYLYALSVEQLLWGLVLVRVFMYGLDLIVEYYLAGPRKRDA